MGGHRGLPIKRKDGIWEVQPTVVAVRVKAYPEVFPLADNNREDRSPTLEPEEGIMTDDEVKEYLDENKLEPEIDDDDDEWPVEKVVAHKVEDGKEQFSTIEQIEDCERFQALWVLPAPFTYLILATQKIEFIVLMLICT